MKRVQLYTPLCLHATLLAAATAAATLPQLAAAQSAGKSGDPTLTTLLSNILQFGNDVFIPFVMGIGFLVFVWGVFRHFIVGGADEEQKAKGRSFVINVIIGFVAIIIFWGVINLIASSTGLAGETLKHVPATPTP